MTSKARELADLLDASGNIKTKAGRTTQGRNLTNDGTKLDGIEANATADQTHSEIRALIVAGSDTNVFTDADHTKLDGIESGATADQTDAEIRAAVEAATDSNVFTDADHSKLNAIEAGATADQTKADIDALNIDADTLDGKQLATIESEYQSYADTAAANVVDSAPAALNTLNELAAALGDDANFATTTATSLGEKLPKSGGQMTGNITMSGSQTVDGRDLSVDGAKLDGIEANATADQSAAEIRALVESASDSNVFTDADHSKLNGIEANAKNDQTITAGGGLTGGGTGDVTISHSDTSSVSSTDNSGNTFVQDLTFDTYGHVTAVGTGSVSVGDGTLTVQGTGALGGSGTFTANQSGNTTISISHDDTSSQASVNGSGRTYIQDVTLDAYGHVTGLATATETVVNTDTNTIPNNATITLSAGGALTGGGNFTTDQSSNETITFNHSDTSSQGSVNNSGRTYIQDITLDGYGHVTGINSATETVVNTDTNTTYSAGSGLDLSGTTFSVESDLRGEVYYIGRDGSDYIGVETTQINFVLDNAVDMRLYNSGDLHVEGNVIAYSTTISDERLKKDITKIDNALDKVSQLNGYTFEYLADGKKSAGVIAQEVEKVMPSAITESTLPLKMGEDDKTEYKTVQYDQLIGLLVEAVKELKAEIAALKGQ
jgi:hypothetical protein